MLARLADLLQTVLYLLRVNDVCHGYCSHSHYGVHRSPDIVAHIRKKFASGLIGVNCLFPCLFQLDYMLTVQAEVLCKDQHQNQQNDCTAAQHQ